MTGKEQRDRRLTTRLTTYRRKYVYVHRSDKSVID